MKTELETQIMTLESQIKRDSRPSLPNKDEDDSGYNEDDEENKDNK